MPRIGKLCLFDQPRCRCGKGPVADVQRLTCFLTGEEATAVRQLRIYKGFKAGHAVSYAKIYKKH